MGPYCNFCQTRCFAHIPVGTPQEVLDAYGTSTIVATCPAGQEFERQKIGWCWKLIWQAIAAAEVEKLRALLATGEFHHATYRDHGRLFEGLYFYRRDAEGFQGFSLAGAVQVRMHGETAVREAEELVKHTGISVGAYGEG